MRPYRSHPLETGVPPSWASEWGDDICGPFVAFEVKGVSQWLRWIPAGQFLMGSSEDDSGRSDEVQREVTLTGGFFLAESPCTQALWEAVMGDNPSYFVSPERPVERVSWDDCQVFLQRLNELVPGLQACLPTEAQWEYACRAGTTTATYAGPVQILGVFNAPVLDPIAWYGGNSGRAFELDNGVDCSAWQERQYDDPVGGTHPVGQKQPNAWGLYDMLGNVWEWSADWYGSYEPGPVTDPSGPAQGRSRVIRGGSWDYDARVVRAACRVNYPPDYRSNDLGFRLARGHVW